MNWLTKLTPTHIRDLIPYASARRVQTQGGEIWLNANESPYVRRTSGSRSDLNRYPDFQPAQLLGSYAKYAGVETNQLLVTRGIDEGIDLLVRSFCMPGEDRIIYTPPTYGMYQISAETNAVKCLPVPLSPDWELNVQEITGQIEAAKLIFLCSPNNPTGNILERSAVLEILEAAQDRAIVILDEAYIEFSPDTAYVNLLSEFPNLVLMRTLSKAFGMAGLRCGFLMTNPEIIATLQKVIAPYPIPVPVGDIALETLSEAGIAQMAHDVKAIGLARQALADRLTQFQFIKNIHTGAANFLLLKVSDAAAFMQVLQEQGIIIRDRSSQPGLDACVRITVGSEAENNRLLESIKQYEEAR